MPFYFRRKYATASGTGTEIIVPIQKRAVIDFAVSADWTPAAGDVKVSIDGGVAANIGTLPVAVTRGNTAGWKFVFTIAEVTGKYIEISISDSATKAVEDDYIIIETFGNASAMYPVDHSLAQLAANVTQWTGTNVATPDTAGYPKVTHKAGTGTGELNITSGVVDANATKWNGTAVSTPDTAGQPKVTVAAGVGTGQLSLTAGVIAATVAGAVGSVTGAVGSVTGAVGSVTGAVGSVTGNVGGNVVGSVGSVTGAVASVTGAVGSVTGAVASVTGAVGSVTGAVGSVTGAVTVGTNNDKTGYALTTAGIDAILDRPIAEPVGAFSWGAASLRTIIQWLGVLGRNKNTQTATTHLVRNDADSGTLGTAAVSDDGTTFIHGKYS